MYGTPPRKVTKPVPRASRKGSPPRQTNETFVVDVLAYAISCRNPVDLQKIWLNGELVYHRDATDSALVAKSAKTAATFQFFNGTTTQLPSNDIVLREGAGNVPAFRQISYIVFKEVDLSNYGNSYPSFTCLVEQINPPNNLREFIDVQLATSGNYAAYTKFAGQPLLVTDPILATLPFLGISFMADGVTRIDKMRPMLDAWGCILQKETNSPRTLIKLPPDPTILPAINGFLIDIETQLGANGDSPYSIKDSAADQIPNVLSLTYPDVDTDYEPDTVTIRTLKNGQENAIAYTVDFSLNKSQAITMATRMLRNLVTKKTAITFRIPLNSLLTSELTQGRIVSFTGDQFLLHKLWLINSITVSDNGFVEYVASYYLPINNAYTTRVQANEEYGISVPPAAQAISRYAVIDNVGLTINSDRRQPHTFFDTTGNVPVNAFFSDGGVYNLALTSSAETTSFYTDTISFPTLETYKHRFVPDYQTEVDVVSYFNGASILSVANSKFTTGQSVIAIGREFVGFETAFPISPGRWRLRGLLRETYDSEPVIDNPGSSLLNQEAFVIKTPLVETTRQSFIPTSGPIPANVYLKASPDLDPNLDVSGLATSAVTPYNNNIGKALPCCLLPPRKTATGWEFKWTPRSSDRSNFTYDDGQFRANNPDGNTYRLSIYDQATTTLITTQIVTGEVFTYSTANTSIFYTIEQRNGVINSGFGFPRDSRSQGN